MKNPYQVRPAQLEKDSVPVVFHQDSHGTMRPLSSKYSPSAEATRILTKPFKNQTSPSMVFLLGCGNIALITQALELYKTLPIVIICRDTKLLDLIRPYLPKTLVKNRTAAQPPLFYMFSDLIETAAANNVSAPAIRSEIEPTHRKEAIPTLTPQFRESLAIIFKHHSTQHIRFHSNPKEVANDPIFYEAIQSAITIEQEEKSINRATFRRFEKLWFRNLIKNTAAIIDAVPLTQLLAVMKGYPVVIAGAAPSLEADIPFLKRYQNNVLVIAVDTAYAVLLKHGISCDLVVSIDPQKTNAKYLEAIASTHTQKTILVAEPSISHHGMRKFPRIFMFDNFSPYYAYLTGFFTPKGSIKVGGSVATVAFEIVKHANPSAVALAGIDLAYSREAYHLSGAFHEEKWFSEINRLDTFQTRLFSIMNSKDVVPIRSRNDQIVYTDAAMELYKRWFEENCNNLSFPVVHTSTRAQPIKGIPYLALSDFFTQHAPTSAHKDNFRENAYQLCQKHQLTAGSGAKDFLKRKNLFNQATQSLIDRLQSYHDTGKGAATIIKTFLKHPNRAKSPNLLKKLDVFNSRLQHPSIEKEFTAIVMQRALYDISDTTFTKNTASDHPGANSPTDTSNSTYTAHQQKNIDQEAKIRLEKALLLYKEVMNASNLCIRYLKIID